MHVWRQVFGLCAAVFVLAAFASAQSLGELARKLRAEKAAQPARAVRLFTNDDLAQLKGGLSVTEGLAPPSLKGGPEGAAKAEEKGGAAEKPGGAAKAGAEDETAWRQRFAKLRDALDTAEKKLDVMQRELNLANIQYYSNPDQALREQTMGTEIKTRTQEIEQQKVAVEAAKKALADAEEELRQKGLPAGWAR
jgi:hypothetical protein